MRNITYKKKIHAHLKGLWSCHWKWFLKCPVRLLVWDVRVTNEEDLLALQM